LIIFAGVFMCVVAVLLLFIPLRGAIAGGIQGGGTVLLIIIGLKLINVGRKKKARLAEDVLSQDGRPPIIYLRSFETDGIQDRGFYASRTYEEQLAKALRPMGPFVAIGRPGERSPELGAARLYVDDAGWQNKVQEMLPNAGLVILRLGASVGLVWELEQIRKLVDPRKVILDLPIKGRRGPLDIQQYAQVVEMAPKAFFLPALNELQGARFICFDDEWTPIVMRLHNRLDIRQQLGGREGGTPILQASVIKLLNKAFK